MKKILYILLIVFLAFNISNGDNFNGTNIYVNSAFSLKNVNGKFYAYIVLLFNENPHFINLIQKDTVPLKEMSRNGFQLRFYKNYLMRLNDSELKKTAAKILQIYLDSNKFSPQQLHKLEQKLLKKNIILQFTKNSNLGENKIVLNYCIYGKLTFVKQKHPFLKNDKKIFNIQPFIYYDEFSTSNSTFYYDMIYINKEEVLNDYIIVKKIISNQPVGNLFFVGSKVSSEIKECIQKAFPANSSKNIKKEIWNMFVIHELTHKIINNKFNYFKQANGEALSLTSTIYCKPFLGLSVLFSYLAYNQINPHRIAANNFIKYIALKTKDKKLIQNPKLLLKKSSQFLKIASKEYFYQILKKLR